MYESTTLASMPATADGKSVSSTAMLPTFAAVLLMLCRRLFAFATRGTYVEAKSSGAVTFYSGPGASTNL